MDDPLLTPRSRMQQRTYAMSRASGRKAARYLLNKYDRKFGVFSHDEPHVDSLSPSPLLAIAEKEDEEALNALIDLRSIRAAHRLYSRLLKNRKFPRLLIELSSSTHELVVCAETKLSMKTQLRLLDALCAFGNDLEAGEREYRLEPEERWYLRELTQAGSSGSKSRDPLGILTRWQHDSPAEQLFACILDELKLSEVATTSADSSNAKSEDMDAESRQTLLSASQAVIRGAAKYGSANRALELLEVCRRYSIVPDLLTYNSVITVLSRSSLDNARRVDTVLVRSFVVFTEDRISGN